MQAEIMYIYYAKAFDVARHEKPLVTRKVRRHHLFAGLNQSIFIRTKFSTEV